MLASCMWSTQQTSFWFAPSHGPDGAALGVNADEYHLELTTAPPRCTRCRIGRTSHKFRAEILIQAFCGWVSVDAMTAREECSQRRSLVKRVPLRDKTKPVTHV